MVSGQWFGSSTVSLACIISMCSVQRFPGSHSLRLAFGSFCTPILPLLISVAGAWFHQLGAHGWRARVCQPWRCNSVKGLAVPRVETPGHPEHPPLLSDAVVNYSIILKRKGWKRSLKCQPSPQYCSIDDMLTPKEAKVTFSQNFQNSFRNMV